MEKEPLDLRTVENFDGMEVSEVEGELEVVSTSLLSSGLGHLFNAAFEIQSLDKKLVQSFRIGRKFEENDEGRLELVSKGIKKGMFLAAPHPEFDGKVIIGYSLCHKKDRFDYKDDVKLPGLGTWYALLKAKKYANSERFVIATDARAKQLPKPIVKIPQSMAKDLAKFIIRCRKFYKDKELPEWTINFALDQIPKLGLEPK